MRMNDVFPSTYLKADDVPHGKLVGVRVDRVDVEMLGQGKDAEKKPVMYFIGKEKGLVMNKTNWQTVADVYGDESDEWHGKPLQIARDRTTFGGKSVECLRLRIPVDSPQGGNGGGQYAPAVPPGVAAAREQVRNRQPVPSPVSEEEQFKDDDIPF